MRATRPMIASPQKPVFCDCTSGVSPAMVGCWRCVFGVMNESNRRLVLAYVPRRACWAESVPETLTIEGRYVRVSRATRLGRAGWQPSTVPYARMAASPACALTQVIRITNTQHAYALRTLGCLPHVRPCVRTLRVRRRIRAAARVCVPPSRLDNFIYLR